MDRHALKVWFGRGETRLCSLVSKDRFYKPKVKGTGAQRESGGVVVPHGNGKRPDFGHVGSGGKRQGMAGTTRSNNPHGLEPMDKVRKLQRRLYAAAKRSPARSIATCASFMSDLMKQMRQFQRRDTEPPSSGDVSPVPVIKLALSMCRSGSMLSGAKLVYEGPLDIPQIRATSTDLMQILVNLVRNAQQALEEHAMKDGVVTVNASVEDELVRFVVHDNGPGIAPAVLEKLGTAFFTTRAAGTGLGVNQCKRLVGRLGGYLDILSTVGAGTTVVFTLPTLRIAALEPV